ncbi:hypothetical protein PG988_007342 [Apiospora saccharicola]
MALLKGRAVEDWPPAAGTTEPRELPHHTYMTEGDEDGCTLYIVVNDTDEGQTYEQLATEPPSASPTCRRTPKRTGTWPTPPAPSSSTGARYKRSGGGRRPRLGRLCGSYGLGAGRAAAASGSTGRRSGRSTCSSTRIMRQVSRTGPGRGLLRL